jgi:hypothetical protein
MMKIKTPRTNVTIDDRRAVIVLARGRSNADIVRVPQEAFIRRSLKERLGLSFDQPAPEGLKIAAKEMAASLAAERSRAHARAMAALAAMKAAEEATVAEDLAAVPEAIAA